MEEPKPLKDIANGTTGSIPNQPGHGYTRQFKRINWNNPVMSEHAGTFDRTEPSHAVDSNIRYSSMRVLQRIKSRDSKKGLFPKYDAGSIRSVLSARSVKDDEQHWAGMGDKFAPTGKHDIDFWIKHASNSLPRFYSTESEDKGNEYKNYSIGQEANRNFSSGRAVGSSPFKYSMTNVNYFLPHGDEGPQVHVGDGHINKALKSRHYFHQNDTEPSEIGHYRSVHAPLSAFGDALVADRLDKEARKILTTDPGNIYPMDLDDVLGNLRIGYKKLEHGSAKAWLLDHEDAQTPDDGFMMHGRNRSDKDIDNLFDHPDLNPDEYQAEYDAIKRHYGEDIDSSRESLESLRGRLFNNARNVFGYQFDSNWDNRKPKQDKGQDWNDYYVGTIPQMLDVYKEHVDWFKKNLRDMRDIASDYRQYFAEPGNATHIEEHQSDYFQHPKWFQTNGPVSKEREDIEAQLDDLNNIVRRRASARKNFYETLNDASKISTRDLMTNHSSPLRPDDPDEVADSMKYHDYALNLGDAYKQADHGMSGKPVTMLQARLAELYARGGLDVNPALPEISKFVSNTADRIGQEYTKRSTANLSEQDPDHKQLMDQAIDDAKDINKNLHLEDGWDTRAKMRRWESLETPFSGSHSWVKSGGYGVHPLSDIFQLIRGKKSFYSDGTRKFEWPSEMLPLESDRYNKTNGLPQDPYDYPFEVDDAPDAIKSAIWKVHSAHAKTKMFDDSRGHTPFQPTIPELHWTRAIVNKIGKLAREYTTAQGFAKSGNESAIDNMRQKRDALYSYVNDITRPYQENGLHDQPFDSRHSVTGKVTMGSGADAMVDEMDKPVNERIDFSRPDTDPKIKAQRQAHINDLIDSIVGLYQNPSDISFAQKDALEKRLKELEGLPVEEVIPVQERHRADPTDKDKPLERPMGNAENAIRFMIRHAIMSAVMRGDSHISVAAKGIRNGSKHSDKPGSFWDRLANMGREELKKFASEHGEAVRDVPWFFDTTKPIVRVNDKMRESLKTHGLHAFDNGYPSTVDRVSKSLVPLSIVIIPRGRYIASANTTR